ncbi:MAG: hypothetical protein ACOY93_10370 [Bacillota bacterium]
MRQVMRYVTAALLAGLLLAGCSSGQEAQPAPSEPAPAQAEAPKEAEPKTEPAPSPKVGDLTQREVDAAEGVVVLYFDAVVNQDTALINFLTADAAASDSRPVPKGGKASLVQEIKALKAVIQDGYPTVYFEVKVDLGPSPGGDWSPGVNHRWVQVQKLKDGWKVKALTTSPPAL